ncbi:MAG: hypothetical protein RR348_03040 [Clostridia bacterium]
MKSTLADYQEMWDEIFILQCEEITMGVNNKKKIDKIVSKLRKNSHKMSFEDVMPIQRGEK